MGETAILAQFVEETSLANIPDEVQEKAKEAITDFVGVALYGSQHDIGDRVWLYVDETMGDGSATVLGSGAASPPGAALANGSFGHAIDYDDTFESIVIHPTSPVFSSALAASDRVDASGADVLAAYICGVEVAYRVGHSTYPSHYENGWHSTGTIGTFGATAAAASVLGMSTEEIRSAFGITSSESSSLKKNFGTMTKPLHSGHAAQMGVRAAMLASEGFTADPNIFEEKIGYGNTMTPYGEYEPNEIKEGLGESWSVMDIGYKPYPSGVITHAAMDAMRDLVINHDLEPADVRHVTVSLDAAASEMLHHENPENSLQAKFSIEFCLAAVLREGDPGIHEFTDEYVTAPDTREQMAKVTRDFKVSLFGGNFANYAARVVVETTDGEQLETEEKFAPGSPSNPISAERLRDKFNECATIVLTDSAAKEAYEAIKTLDEPGSLEQLRSMVSSSRA